MLTLLFSLIAGTIFGIVYGLLFLAQKRSLFIQTQQSSASKNISLNKLTAFLFLSIRILLLSCGAYYLLRSPQIVLILVLTSFLIAFWGTIAKKKVILHEGHRDN